MKRIWFYVIVFTILMLIGINGVYYVTTKNTLIKMESEEVSLVVKNVNYSIDSSKRAEKYYNDLLASQLRMVSIAIQNELPPDIKDVSSDKLRELAKKYDLKGIDLWIKAENNDVVITKSSDPQAIGMGSMDWDDKKWYHMFSQLLEKQDVDYIDGFGEELPNFWSGPVDTRMVDKKSITKWGYYQDGTTNYIIDPYVNDTVIASFLKNGGTDKAIDLMIHQYPFLLGISVLNVDALVNGEKTMKDFGVVWFSDRLVTHGKYKRRHKDDAKNAYQAFHESKNITKKLNINGQNVLRTYIPTNYVSGQNIDQNLVIFVTSDYDEIQEVLNQKTSHIFLITMICFLVSGTLMYIFIRYSQKQEKTLLNVESIYSKNIESLFKTIKEHRHDFNHHIFTILGLTNMKMYDELKEYVQNLSHIQNNFNDIIHVNIPAFSGLLQAKIAEAIEKQIVFEHHFENFEYLSLDMMKTTNLVRVVGNVLDNAFHAVEESEKEIKKVTIIGKYKEGSLSIQVHNNGLRIPCEQLETIFEHGFTTREKNGGTGIGLASSQKIMNEYKGSIDVTSDDNWTTFSIKLPISQREMISPKDKTVGGKSLHDNQNQKSDISFL